MYILYNHPARGRVGKVTDCGVRGLGFKSLARFLLLELKPGLYHEWSEMVEIHVDDKKSPQVESKIGRCTVTSVLKTTLILKLIYIYTYWYTLLHKIPDS